MQALDCTEQNSDGRHGLMYFDIALLYHATIKVAQPEQKQGKNPNRIIITASPRLPFHTGFDLLTAEVITVGSNQP